MKQIEFKQDSWHCQVAKLGGHRRIYSDICQYTRDFIWGAFLILLMTAGFIIIGTVFFTFTGAAIYQSLASLVTQTSFFDEIGTLGLGFWVLGTLGWLIQSAADRKFECINKLFDRPYEYVYEEPKKPGFVKLAYGAWKDKYCFTIKTTG